jgi:hypothetical protein
MDVDIYFNGKIIKQYVYKDTVTGWTSLFSTPRASSEGTHKTFIDRLLSDLEKDRVFPDFQNTPNQEQPAGIGI